MPQNDHNGEWFAGLIGVGILEEYYPDFVSMHNITIYSTPNCAYCKMTKEYLTERNIPYTDFDVSQDREKQEEMIKKSGQFGVPVIDIDGTIIIGFDKRKLDELVGSDMKAAA